MKPELARRQGEEPPIKVKPGEPIRISPSFTFPKRDYFGCPIETYDIEVEGIGKGEIVLRQDSRFETNATLFAPKLLAGPVETHLKYIGSDDGFTVVEQTLPITVSVEMDDVDHPKRLECRLVYDQEVFYGVHSSVVNKPDGKARIEIDNWFDPATQKWHYLPFPHRSEAFHPMRIFIERK